MLPTSMPTPMGYNRELITVTAPASKSFLAKGSMSPTGNLVIRKRGRIFGRPGLVVLGTLQPYTVDMRIRRN